MLEVYALVEDEAVRYAEESDVVKVRARGCGVGGLGRLTLLRCSGFALNWTS